MSENPEKTCEKSKKNRVNPYGTGIMRMKMVEILFSTTTAITVTEIATRLQATHAQATTKWVRTVLEEVRQVGVLGMPLQMIQKRVGTGRYPAYYIQKPKNKTT